MNYGGRRSHLSGYRPERAMACGVRLVRGCLCPCGSESPGHLSPVAVGRSVSGPKAVFRANAIVSSRTL